jgi:hypothetical protein
MRSFVFVPWPALPEGHVRVTPQQFQELARLGERQAAGAISHGEFVSASLAVCPDLRTGRVNHLHVDPKPWSTGCMLR